MDSETQMIRRQMDETRSNLAEKLTLLEDELRAGIRQSSKAVVDTLDTVNTTVLGVKDSVECAVAKVKNSVDLRQQVDKRPWVMFTAATAAGFIGASLIERRTDGAGPRVIPNEADNAAWNDTQTERGNASKLMDLLDDLPILKGVAAGTVFGVIRELAGRQIRHLIAQKLEDAINTLSAKVNCEATQREPIHPGMNHPRSDRPEGYMPGVGTPPEEAV